MKTMLIKWWWVRGVLLGCALVVSSAGAQDVQPRVTQIWPEEQSVVGNDTVFVLQLSRALEQKPQALCDIAGIRSAIPTAVLTGAKRSEALQTYGLHKVDDTFLALRCQTNFPDGASVTVRWPKAEPLEDGAIESTDYWGGQRFHFRARSEWPVSVICTRSNAEEGCNPLEPVNLRFTSMVDAKQAAEVVLVDAEKRSYKPKILADHKNQTDKLVFTNLPARQTLSVQWPGAGLWDRLRSLYLPGSPSTDSFQQVLKGSSTTELSKRKPITIRMSDYPPLLKFGATFGIVERSIGGVVPLTVRSIEGAPGTQRARLRSLRLGDEEAVIETLQTLLRVTARDDDRPLWDGEECCEDSTPPEPTQANSAQPRYPFALPDDKQGRRGDADSRRRSWLKAFRETKTQDLPLGLASGAFEVVGIPLTEPGFYLLEAESLNLGRNLLGHNSSMFVRSGALVTDLGVHLHLGEESAMVWVTSLSTGQALPSAEVTIYDCRGKLWASGKSNVGGWVQLDAAYPKNRYACPLYAFAKSKNKRGGVDMGFVRSDWQKGIQTWRFETLKNADASTDKRMVHVLLPRKLLQAGEMLYGKVFWRTLNTRGDWGFPAPEDLPSTITLAHDGSGKRTAIPVTWNPHANGEFSYELPIGAKRGVYRVQVGENASDHWEETAATFRVEDFRLPLLKAEVLSSSAPIVLGGREQGPIPVQLRLAFLSGGVAAGESVSVAHRLLPHVVRFKDYEDYFFSSEERYQPDDREEREAIEAIYGQDLDAPDSRIKLGSSGQATIRAKVPARLSAPKTLLTEMEYQDPNGETYRAQGSSVLWPANVVLGAKAPQWASGKAQSVEYIVLNPKGKPQPNVLVTVEGGFKGFVTHRRKTVGGFYSYHWEQRDEPLRPLCSGRSDRAGRFVCHFQPEMGELDGGAFRVSSKALDAQGRISQLVTSLYLYAGGEVWFTQSDHDRMDVVPEKTRYSVGEEATIQVRSPFRQATVWVNVMRAGAVIDTLVLPITGSNPSIRLPIKPGYAPNAFVNILAVRGRVADPGPTALVDLARPAFKLGITHLEVGGGQHALQVKVTTDRETYQSREVAQVALQVSRSTSGVMPADGEAAVFAIDEALLELVPNDTWDALKTFLTHKGYGFETASAAMQVLGKRHYGRKALPPGGDGSNTSPTRELFDTLLAWHGTVKLDAQGRATVQIPVNDSLTRFRVVAVVNAGNDLFGTGQTSFTATKDLQILPGLPATVREGDRFAANVTFRNTTNQAMQVRVTASTGPVNTVAGEGQEANTWKVLSPQSLNLGPKESKIVTWPTQAPTDSSTDEWAWRFAATGVVRGTGGKTASDNVLIKQTLAPHLQALRYTVGAQALAAQQSASFTVTPPTAAVAGKGELRVSLSPSLASDAAGVRDYMRDYPFACLEQRTSKAVALRDQTLWEHIAQSLDQYITYSGLVNYYPSQSGYSKGYDVLTAYVLSAAHEAGFALPEDAKIQMLGALARFVEGKLESRFDYYGNNPYDLTERKLLALEALSRYQNVLPHWVDSLRVDSRQDLPRLSHRALIQWLDVLQRTDWPSKETLTQAALAQLKTRLQGVDGALRLKPNTSDGHWYYMYSLATSQVRLGLLALTHPQLQDQADAIALGAIQMQKNGAWRETQANMWGSLMLDRRAERKNGELGGLTRIQVAGHTVEHDWQQAPAGKTYVFPASAWSHAENQVGTDPTPQARAEITHLGGGTPFVTALGTAWGPITQPQKQGAHVSHTIKPIKQAKPGQWSVGDVAEVTVSFEVDKTMGWLVLTDPIPSGATLLGSGLGGQAALPSNDDANRHRWYDRPAYVERTFTHIRAYYEYLWDKRQTLTYQVRLNNVGTFTLPATQLEAMYDPSVYAYGPRERWEVK